MASATIQREIRRLCLRRGFLVYRQAARRVLDSFRFGDGVAERLAAAAVIGALFFLIVIVASIAFSVPLNAGLGIAFAALVAAWVTSAIFVFGKPDEGVELDLERTNDLLYQKRQEAELIAQQEAAIAQQEERRPPAEERGRPREPDFVACPYCDGTIPAWVARCKHCGEIVDEGYRQKSTRPVRRQTFYPLAAFLSWLFPGLGQISKGQVGRGIMWMLAVVAGLICCIVPGIVIAVLGIFDAAFYSE